MGLKIKDFANITMIIQLALIMIIPIFAGVYIGSWLDQKLGTGSIFLLICVLLGVITSFLNLYRYTVNSFKNKDERNHDEEGK